MSDFNGSMLTECTLLSKQKRKYFPGSFELPEKISSGTWEIEQVKSHFKCKIRPIDKNSNHGTILEYERNPGHDALVGERREFLEFVSDLNLG